MATWVRSRAGHAADEKVSIISSNDYSLYIHCCNIFSSLPLHFHGFSTFHSYHTCECYGVSAYGIFYNLMSSHKIYVINNFLALLFVFCFAECTTFHLQVFIIIEGDENWSLSCWTFCENAPKDQHFHLNSFIMKIHLHLKSSK